MLRTLLLLVPHEYKQVCETLIDRMPLLNPIKSIRNMRPNSTVAPFILLVQRGDYTLRTYCAL